MSFPLPMRQMLSRHLASGLLSGHQGAAAYVIFASACVSTGWILSIFHALSPLSFAAGVVVFCALLTGLVGRGAFPAPRVPPTRRFRRILPGLFLLLACLVLLGGLFHEPNNYDGMTYRTPRVLHWIAEAGWHWIPTPNQRMNTRPAVFEWMCVPELLLLRSDKWQFLLNFWSFLLLPGQCFALFNRLGIQRRAAASWMWIVPMGLCYPLQAGGNSNTSFAVTFALASVIFALDALKQKSPQLMGLSFLAVGLLTGSKAVNIPLGLPWLIAALPALWLLRRRWIFLGTFSLWGLAVSIVPISVLNHLHCGDWTGMAAEKSVCAVNNRPLAFVGNIALLTMQNLQPPIFPGARQLTEKLAPLVPDPLAAEFGTRVAFFFTEMQMEELAGLGLGVTLLIVSGFVAGWRRKEKSPWLVTRHAKLIVTGAWIALAVYMLNSAIDTGARMLSPYYPLLLTALLWGGHQAVFVSSRWFKGFAAVNGLATVLLIALLPARPLLPVPALIQIIPEDWQQNALFQRASTVYRVYGARSDVLKPLVEKLPQAQTVAAMISPDAPETSLWRPFASRRILRISPTADLDDLRKSGVRWLIIGEVALVLQHDTMKDYLARNGLVPVTTEEITVRAASGLELYVVVDLTLPVQPPNEKQN